jgi:hypothetical protein
MAIRRYPLRVVGILVVLVLALFIGSDPQAKTKKLKFKGRQLWDKRTGLTILPNEEEGRTGLSSRCLNYVCGAGRAAFLISGEGRTRLARRLAGHQARGEGRTDERCQSNVRKTAMYYR